MMGEETPSFFYGFVYLVTVKTCDSYAEKLASQVILL